MTHCNPSYVALTARLAPEAESTSSFFRYLEQVDRHLLRLTCGLLRSADFDFDWHQAWSEQVPAQHATEAALTADGFVVSQLPTPFMQQLRQQPLERN